MFKRKFDTHKLFKNSVISGAAAVVMIIGGGTAVAADSSHVSFSMEEAVHQYYGEFLETTTDNNEDFNIGLNTMEGAKGFEEKESSLTYPVDEMFGTKDNVSYINEASGKIVVSVSNPNVASLEEGEQTAEKTITSSNTADEEITLYGRSEGAATMYLNEVDGDSITTLGTVEVEVK